MAKEPEITDYNYIGSAIGNAYFSDVGFEQLWSAVNMSKNREELDAAVAASVKIQDIIKDEKG